LWWLEHELVVVHRRHEEALVELRRVMGAMDTARTHEVASLTEKGDGVRMICIQNTIRHTADSVVPCVTDGDKTFEEVED
jgi:hypothetical protein